MRYFMRFRRRLRHASGLIFAFSLLLFVLCLLYVSLSTNPSSIGDNLQFKHRTNILKHINTEAELSQKIEQQHRQQFLFNASWTLPPTNFRGRDATIKYEHLMHDTTQLNSMVNVIGDPDMALESIQFLNMHHEVLNTNQFGLLNSNRVDYVIVVQVHDRIDYLKYLIGSFSRARYIEQSLLVFSHDHHSDLINSLIRSINFCRVIQLFFPYNIQLFPNDFPGRNKQDCPEGSDKKKAKELACADASFTDVGGHYRISRLSQIKHHWWWKNNYIFDGILPKYGLDDKLVLLLEEDHLVTPDFLHVLRLMQIKRKKICPDCELLCLGNYPKTFVKYNEDMAKIGVEFWYSSKYNMGMVIDRKLWERIRSENCSHFFCNYDDYNWDWSMMQLSVKCLASKLRVIYPKAPRVIHIGDCGVHTHRCKADSAVHDALKLFQRVNGTFFPPNMDVSDIGKRVLKPSKPNGGWADPRDHQLCLLNSHPLEREAGKVLAEARAALVPKEESKVEETINTRMERENTGNISIKI